MSFGYHVRSSNAFADIAGDAVRLTPVVNTPQQTSRTRTASERVTNRTSTRRSNRTAGVKDIAVDAPRAANLVLPAVQEQQSTTSADETTLSAAAETRAALYEAATSPQQPLSPEPIVPALQTQSQPVENTPSATLPPTIHTQERFVEILPEINQLFKTQPVTSFQNRVRPLTAPRLDDRAIELSRAHNELNIYSLQSLYRQDWYVVLSLVRGLTHRPETDFVSVQTFAPRSSRSDPYAGGGDASMSRYAQYGLQVLTTPANRPQDEDKSGPVLTPPVPSAPEQSELFPEQQRGATESVDPLRSLEQQLNTPIQQPGTSITQRLELINDAVLSDPSVRTITSGATLRDLQRRLDELHGDEMLADSRLAAATAEKLRRDMRKALADNSPWLNDPLQTTGVVVLTPAYVAAKAEALSLIRSYCVDTSLATVPEREYIRTRPHRILPDGRRDTHWETVRTMFVRLIADVFVQRRMLIGQGVRHKGDLARITSEINGNLAQFRHTVGYDARPGYNTFYLVTPRNDERNQYVYQRASQIRYEPYASVLGPQYGNASNAPTVLDTRNSITTRMLSL